MRIKDRETVFNKFGGKCAYCGEELQKGWHVDEIEPVIRNRKAIPAGWYHKVTKEHRSIFDIDKKDEYEWKDRRYVSDGCVYPERFNLANQMPSCASCNINKHSGTLEEFREAIMGYMKHLNGINTQYKIAKRYGLVVETNIEVKFYFETI
jgi:hypothetical protein